MLNLVGILIPTKLSLADEEFKKVIYPPAIVKKLGFGRQKLALYENRITLSASLPYALKKKPYFSIQVQLQACNDKHCLAPETVQVGVLNRIN